MLDITLLVVAILVLLACQVAGVFLTAMQLPGTWFMLLTTGLFAWWRWDGPSLNGGPMIGWLALVALLVLAILGEILETVTAAVGSKQAGGSTRGAVISIGTAIIGAIVGSVVIPIPIIGTLIGAAIGAGIGAYGGDRWAGRSWEEALKGAKGAVYGKITGTVAKLVVAILMGLITIGSLAWVW